MWYNARKRMKTMFKLPAMLLLDRGAFWKTLRGHGVGWAGVASMAVFVVASCAVYGALMAFWRSPLMACYAAAKLPMVFVGSTAVVAVFNWMVAATLNSGLSFRQSVALAYAAMAVACWILLALAPVVFFFIVTGAPQMDGAWEEAVGAAHRAMPLTHVAVLALAGVLGNASLFNGLRAVVRPGCPPAALFLAWIVLFAIVGCQMSWILRPFVGTPGLEVAFLREEALKDNFFEVVFGRLLPGLFKGVEFVF
jgi:hypothetical protein